MTKLVLGSWMLALTLASGAGSIGACGGTDGTGAGSTGQTTQGQGGSGGSGGQATGGSGGTGGGGGGITQKDAKTACTAYAGARCMRVAACSKGFQITSRYGDEDTCEFRVEQQCEAALLAPGEGESIADLNACTAAIPNEICVALLDNNPPHDCLPKPGSRENGDACGTAYQCKSGFCEPNRSSTCGSCSPPPLAGSQCADDTECGATFVCFKGFCAAPGKANATCDRKLHPCIAGFDCVGAHDTTTGTCQASAGMPNAVCDPTLMTGVGCNDSFGLYCNPAKKVCQKTKFADAGEACGVVKGHLVVCKASGKCQKSGTTSTCQAAADDNAACNQDTGPGCLVPAKCQATGDGPEGICTFPDPATCDG